MNVFFEIHDGNRREGPGDTESTIRAYSLMAGLPGCPRILDVGCGPGMQTIDLALNTRGTLVAVDNHMPFLREVRRRADTAAVSHAVNVVCASMVDLPFGDGQFDIIWSEGAIYQLGFGRGLAEWRRLLKPGGYLAVTEASWFRSDLPAAPREFWSREYPEMKSVQENLGLIEDSGYRVIGNFHLPDSSWWINYYSGIEKKLPALEKKYAHDSEALGIIDAEKKEMQLFRDYSSYYGYEFYIMKA
jgi:ubiquinone/menaquinone biosynthesis C-methylase UbiE